MKNFIFLVVTVAALGLLIPTLAEPIPVAEASEPFIAEVKMFAGNFAPRNYAFCDGQLLPIAQNTALFALIGTTYGGDGRTTTALPNCQDRAIVHPGRGPGLTQWRLGQIDGSPDIVLNPNNFPSHSHSIDPEMIPTPDDTDIDGLPDFVERLIGTSVGTDDTDGDLTLDGQEILDGTNPLEHHDTDTFDPTTDTDMDGLSDDVENNITNTNPNEADSDGDEVSDLDEILNGTDPKDPINTNPKFITTDGIASTMASSESLLSRAYPRYMSTAQTTVDMTNVVSVMTPLQGGGDFVLEDKNYQPSLGINHIIALQGLFPSRS